MIFLRRWARTKKELHDRQLRKCTNMIVVSARIGLKHGLDETDVLFCLTTAMFLVIELAGNGRVSKIQFMELVDMLKRGLQARAELYWEVVEEIRAKEKANG